MNFLEMEIHIFITQIDSHEPLSLRGKSKSLKVGKFRRICDVSQLLPWQIFTFGERREMKMFKDFFTIMYFWGIRKKPKENL